VSSHSREGPTGASTQSAVPRQIASVGPWNSPKSLRAAHTVELKTESKHKITLLRTFFHAFSPNCSGITVSRRARNSDTVRTCCVCAISSVVTMSAPEQTLRVGLKKGFAVEAKADAKSSRPSRTKGRVRATRRRCDVAPHPGRSCGGAGRLKLGGRGVAPVSTQPRCGASHMSPPGAGGDMRRRGCN
jgi:hypothetical protein